MLNEKEGLSNDIQNSVAWNEVGGHWKLNKILFTDFENKLKQIIRWTFIWPSCWLTNIYYSRSNNLSWSYKYNWENLISWDFSSFYFPQFCVFWISQGLMGTFTDIFTCTSAFPWGVSKCPNLLIRMNK